MTEINIKIKSVLEPLSKVAQSTDDEHMGTILNLVESSHEPVFIFDKSNKFLGLISATSALYKRNIPYNAKVGSMVVNPPHLTLSSSVFDVVGQMLSTRFYTLPIFDNNKKPIGAVKARTIFKRLIRSPKLLKNIGSKLKVKRPEIIENNIKVKDAFELLKHKKVSRLMVVDKQGKLIAVVTRNDLKNAFINPTPRQRFSKSSGDTGQGMFDNEEVKRNDMPILNFIRNNVAKIDVNTLPVQIIKKFIESKRNSVILVDRDNHPMGLISNRDLLLAISNLDSEDNIPIIFEKPKGISGFIVDEIENKLFEMGRKINRILPLQRFQVSFKEGKNGIGKPNLIETTLSAKFYSGEDFVTNTKNRNVLIGIRENIDKIYNMVRKAALKKKDHTSKHR